MLIGKYSGIFFHDAFSTDIINLPIENCTNEVSSWVKAGMDAFIPSQKYQLKLQSSPWFTPGGTATITHRNHYFQLYQCDSSRHNRCLFATAHNKCKQFLIEAKSLFAEKMRHHITSKNFGSCDDWHLFNRVLNKCKVSIPLLSSIDLRCYHSLLIKLNVLPINSPQALVSTYLEYSYLTFHLELILCWVICI